MQKVRFNLTAYSAGTLTVHGQASAGSNITYVIGGALTTSGGGGGGLADEATFTEGTTTFAPAGCYFKSGFASLTTGQAGAVACTADRMLYVNIGKMGGTAVDMNSGSKSAGTQRVVLATDQPALTNPQPVAFTTGNSQTQPHVCGSYKRVQITTATDTQLVANSGSTNIFVCDFEFSIGSAAVDFYLEKGTSGTCGGLTQLGIVHHGLANMTAKASNALYRGLNTGASNQLCINTNTVGPLDIGVYYDQY
jgi:hypothetical protein